MRCFFLRDGRIADFEMLTPGLSDEDAIAQAHILFSKRKGPFEGFEVWVRRPSGIQVSQSARREG